jgi:hypothetical protein
MTTRLRKPRTRPRRQPDELLVCMPARGRRERTIALQWHDGAGELHVEVLSAAQSWPFLKECR